MINPNDIQQAQARYRKAAAAAEAIPDDAALRDIARIDRELLSAERSLDALLSQTERINDKSNLADIVEADDLNA